MTEPQWIEHDGSAVCPVPEGHDVELKYRNGEILRTTEAHVYRMDWDHDCLDMPQHDITHYRDWTAWEQQQESKMAEPKLLTEADARRLAYSPHPASTITELRERGLIAQEPEPVDPLREAVEAACNKQFAEGGNVVEYLTAELRSRGLAAERKPLTREELRKALLADGWSFSEGSVVSLHAVLTEAMQ